MFLPTKQKIITKLVNNVDVERQGKNVYADYPLRGWAIKIESNLATLPLWMDRRPSHTILASSGRRGVMRAGPKIYEKIVNPNGVVSGGGATLQAPSTERMQISRLYNNYNLYLHIGKLLRCLQCSPMPRGYHSN